MLVLGRVSYTKVFLCISYVMCSEFRGFTNIPILSSLLGTVVKSTEENEDEQQHPEETVRQLGLQWGETSVHSSGKNPVNPSIVCYFSGR